MDEETLNNLFDKVNPFCVCMCVCVRVCVCVCVSLSLSLSLSVLFLCQFYSAHHTSELTVEILTLTHLQS